jgi:hypothetical protein
MEEMSAKNPAIFPSDKKEALNTSIPLILHCKGAKYL